MAFLDCMNFKTLREQLSEFDFSAKECSNSYVFSQEIGVYVSLHWIIHKATDQGENWIFVYARDFTVFFSIS